MPLSALELGDVPIVLFKPFGDEVWVGGSAVNDELGPLPPGDAPEVLKQVWLLVLRWGVSDDVRRSEMVEAGSDEELADLIEAVSPLYPAINAYLDDTGDAEHAVPYGDLAQCAMEAQFEVGRRHN